MDGLRLRTVGVSFGVSLGVHALLLGLLLASFSRAVRAPLVVPRVRLVYVDPAPPAAAPRGVAEGGSATVMPAPVVPPPLVAVKPAAAKPLQNAKPVLAKKKVDPPSVPPVVAAKPAAVAPPVEAAAVPPAGVEQGLEGAHGSEVGGTVDGSEHGRPGGGGVVRVGDVATAPVLVTRVVPEYPRCARLAEIEGEVVLEVVVDRYGRVDPAVRIVRSVPELERAAIAAVQRWRFRPARDRDGAAVAVVMEVPVRFVLHEATANAAR